MVAITREILISELTTGVVEANHLDSRIVGVVLFGSRARPDRHPHAARPDSDIDLLPICTENDNEPARGLKDTLYDRLSTFGLDVHFPVILRGARIAIGSINRAITGEIDPKELLHLQTVCCLLDDHSVVITKDKQQGEKIKEFAASVDYALVLKNIFNSQKK